MSETVILNDELRSGFEMALELGLAAATASSEETDTDCHVHGVKLVHERGRTIHGWFAADTCPKSDGTCPYDVSASVYATDGEEIVY